MTHVRFASLAVVLALICGPVHAAPKAAPKREVPLFVANVAAADRLLNGSDRLFRLIERRDLGLAFKATLALSTNGLKGVDRKRPLGLMTLIDPGEAPEPVGVIYLPITSRKDLLESLAAIKVGVKPDGKTYALKWNGDGYAMRIAHRYAFIARQKKSLQRGFGNPAVDFAPLSKHDVAVRIRFDSVPVGMRWMVLDYVRASAEIGLRRGPREALADHRLRQSLGMLALAGLTELLRDGASLTIGGRLEKSPRPATLELRIAARQGTPLARGLADLTPAGAKTSATQKAGNAAVINWKPPASLKPVADSLVGVTIKSGGKGGKAAAGIWATLRDPWFDSGIRVTVRASGESPSVVVQVGTPEKPKNADLQKLLTGLQQSGVIAAVKPNAVRNPRGVFHRFELAGKRGELSGLLGASGESVWLAIGRAGVERALKAKPPKPAAKKPDGEALFQLSIRWAALRAALANDPAFWTELGKPTPAGKPSTDRVHLSVARKGNELIVRAQLEDEALRGFLKLMAGRFTRPPVRRR